MLADLLKRLSAAEPDTSPMPEGDARLALAALLVRIARSDGDYSDVEVGRIDRILATRYGLDDAGARDLRTEAETLERGAPDTVRFTRAIKDSVDYENRIAVIEALWKVVLADGERDAEEDALLRMVAPLLGITDQDSNIARRRVEQAG